MLPLPKSDRFAVVFFCATACLGFLAWAFPNMSRLVTIPGALISFVLMVYFLWPELRAGYRYIVRRYPPLSIIGIGALFVVLIGLATWYSWPQQTPAGIGETARNRPLENLTNSQLRDSAIMFAAKMRAFESNADVLESPHYIPGQSEEQQISEWSKMRLADDARRKQKTLSFANDYLGTAVDLRDEIIIRLNNIGVFKPYVEIPLYDQAGPDVLDGGLLAGPSPVTSAANYLERLARKLP